MKVCLRSYSSDSSSSGYCSALETIVEEQESDDEPWSSKTPFNPDAGLEKEKSRTSRNKNELQKPFKEMSVEKPDNLYANSYEFNQEKGIFFHAVNSGKNSRRNSESRDKEILSQRDLACKLFPEFFAASRDNMEARVEVKCPAALKPVPDPLVESWLGFYGRIN